MSTTVRQKKAVRKKTGKSRKGLTLPNSTTTIELDGKTYFVTPFADMQEWLDDLEDILDSKKAMEEPGESVPFDVVVKSLGLKLPSRRRK